MRQEARAAPLRGVRILAVEQFAQDRSDGVVPPYTVFGHCLGGRGRTGTVVGCWLLRHNWANPSTVLQVLAQLCRNAADASIPPPDTAEQTSGSAASKSGLGHAQKSGVVASPASSAATRSWPAFTIATNGRRDPPCFLPPFTRGELSSQGQCLEVSTTSTREPREPGTTFPPTTLRFDCFCLGVAKFCNRANP
jgi:hypothetical protein